MALINVLFGQWIHVPDDVWVAIYRLLLDYEHGVPRITDSNRLKQGIWRERAITIEEFLADALSCTLAEAPEYTDVLMRDTYEPGTQRMNPIGIAFACAIVYLINRFATGQYEWKLEPVIGRDIFPNLTGSRRRSIDIVAFQNGEPHTVISSKWGIRHDRIRDPQEEADTYKQQDPSLRFYVVTNEYDNARLQKILTYPTIDGVFHVSRNLVLKTYKPIPEGMEKLRDITDLFPLFS